MVICLSEIKGDMREREGERRGKKRNGSGGGGGSAVLP
jgi:hypothetical protein